jgi:lysophospholipase L1-like esterase
VPVSAFERFDAEARAGERLTVAFFGASLTWGANATDQSRTSYRARVAQKLETRYPEAHFTFIDGAIGGTGSNLGVFRLHRDCLQYEPDLVFLDFSANDDIYGDGPEKLATYESLVRRIVTEGDCQVIPVIFPFRWNSLPGTAGDMPGRMAHIRIAEAYGAPVGDAILHIQSLVAKDADLAERIWNIDAVHPGDYGYQLFADAAWQGFEAGIKNKMVCRAPEKMLHADTYMSWSRKRVSQLTTLPKGWAPGPVSRLSAWYDAYMPRWLDDVVIAANVVTIPDKDGKQVKTPVDVAPLVVKFRASTVMLYGEETVKSGQLKAFIDGEHVARVQGEERFDFFDLSSKRFGGNRQYAAVLATGLDPETVHELKLIPVFDDGEDQELRIESICLAGGDAVIVEE